MQALCTDHTTMARIYRLQIEGEQLASAGCKRVPILGIGALQMGLAAPRDQVADKGVAFIHNQRRRPLRMARCMQNTRRNSQAFQPIQISQFPIHWDGIGPNRPLKQWNQRPIQAQSASDAAQHGSAATRIVCIETMERNRSAAAIPDLRCTAGMVAMGVRKKYPAQIITLEPLQQTKDRPALSRQTGIDQDHPTRRLDKIGIADPEID